MITNYNFKKQILIIFLLISTSASFGQILGSIDPSFLPEDRGSVAGVNSGSVINFDGNTSNINSISTQSDGKIIISGTFYKYDNIITPRIARLNSIDGSLDTTFNAVTTDASINYSIVLPNDKIIICGDFTLVNGLSYNRIARLNADGSLDTSFNVGSGFNSFVAKVEIQDDGKIIVMGSFTTFNGISSNSIARLNIQGDLDTSFDLGTGANGNIYDFTLQNDGKIVVVGFFSSFNGVQNQNIIRLNVNGGVDNTFGLPITTNGSIRKVITQSDGKAIIYGTFDNYSGITSNHITRLNVNGTLDTTFSIGSGVIAANMFSPIYDIKIQSDNKILLCGALLSINGVTKNKIVRLNTDGSIDNSFNIGTGFLQIDDYDYNWGMYRIKILNNNKVLVGGQCAFYNGTTRNSIALLNTDGSLDNVFNASYGADAWIMDSKVLDDGKIIISGGFNTFYQTPQSKIVKLNSNGTLDNSFNAPSVPLVPNTFIRSFAIQSDNKILITRNSSTFVDNIYAETGKIERLNADGTLDNSFDTGLGANNVVSKVVLANNKIYVIGNFTNYNGVNINRVVRLNIDGSIDTSFNTGVGPNIGVLDIIILSDSKILICGNFTSVNGITRRKIARLNSNGTLDTTFNGPAINNTVNSIALQNDGKIILGSFLALIRLNTNGSIDNTFVPEQQSGLTFFKVLVQNDNKIIAAGFRPGTSSEKRFFKYNSDGTFDTTFDTGVGITDGIVSTISIETDGKLIVGGDFRSYGVSKDRIIRVNNTVVSLGTSTFSNVEITYSPNPTTSIVNISSPNNAIHQINIYDITGRLVQSQKGNNENEQIDIHDLPNAIYLMEVKNNKGSKTLKIIKQ